MLAWSDPNAVEISPPFESHNKKISSILEKVQQEMLGAPDNPNLAYMESLAYTGLLNIRGAEKGWKDLTKDDSVAKDYLVKAGEARKKAIKSDNENDLKLSAESYRDMVPSLPDSLKVIAYRRMLKTPQYGEYDDIRTRDYFQYSNAYLRMGEYDKAIDVLNQMLAEKEAGNEHLNATPEYIQSKIGEIEGKKLEAARKTASKETYAQTTEPYAEVAKVEPAGAEPVAKVEPKADVPAPKQEAAAIPEPESPVLGWLVIAGVIGLLFFALHMIRRRRK